MFDQDKLPLNLLQSPSAIQPIVLEELENRLLGGEVLEDGNNVCTFLLEMNSSLVATAISAVNNTFPTLYPVRAGKTDDLYKHMSTWDYVNLFSTPASTEVGIFMDVDYLIENAVVMNNNYKKVIIPATSIFHIANYTFGLYYPIEIRINRHTHEILVVHSTSVDNPLFMLTQNTIKHEIRQAGGILGLYITVPVYQFTRTLIEETVDSTAGFIKEYIHNDKFYALRAFIEKDDGSWEETEQTLSYDIYDPYKVTGKLSIIPERNSVSLNIPQIYFDRNMVSSKLKIEMYSTRGELDIDISGIDPETYSMTLGTPVFEDDLKFMTILNHMPTLRIIPSTGRISGGGNGYGFEELRNRVINDSFYSDVLISNDELTKHFADIGFSVTKYIDSITDRMYYCRKALTNNNKELIGAADIPIYLSRAMVDADDISTIVNHSSGTAVTIRPDTIFKYNKDLHRAMPLTDSQLIALTNMSDTELVDYMNDSDNLYTVTPFHIRLEMSDKYPLAHTYDLNKPSLVRNEFVWEDTSMFSQLSFGNITIEHLNQGVGGYHCTFKAYPSANLKYKMDQGTIDQPDATVPEPITPEDDIIVLIVIGDRYQTAHYKETLPNGAMSFEFTVDTSYRITREHKFSCNSFAKENGDNSGEFELEETFTIIGLLDSTKLLGESSTGSGIPVNIPSTHSGYTPMSAHEITLNFGTLISEVYNAVDVTYTDTELARYPYDMFAKYTEHRFTRDVNGAPIYTIVAGEVVLQYDHKLGDWIFEFDDASIVHQAIDVTTGDTVLNIYNVSGIEVGHGLHAEYIEQDTIVTAVDEVANTIEISRAVIADALGSNDLKVGAITRLHKAGEEVLVNGEPSITGFRDLAYLIDSIQIDNKLTFATDGSEFGYMDMIRDNLRTYFGTIRSSRTQLLSNTKIFFKPLRTIGSGSFKLDIDSTFSIDSQFVLNMRIFVSEYIYTNQISLSKIRTFILNIVDEMLETGELSMTVLSEKIKERGGDEIKYIDVLGINDDPGLQTLIPATVDTIPSLARQLKIESSGTITSERAINLEFITI